MTKEEIYLDLSKLTREEIIEVYELIIKNNQFIKPFFKHEYWNKLNYCKIDERWQCSGKNWDGLHSLTEVTLSEFRELFQNLSNSTGLEKISAKDFILNNIPKLIQPIKDKIDWDLIQFSGNNMIDFAEKYYEFLTAKSK